MSTEEWITQAQAAKLVNVSAAKIAKARKKGLIRWELRTIDERSIYIEVNSLLAYFSQRMPGVQNEKQN